MLHFFRKIMLIQNRILGKWILIRWKKEKIANIVKKFCVITLTQAGAHSKNCIDFQEFMIMPVGAKGIRQGLQWCAEVYQELKKLLDQDGHSTGVGD